MQQTRTRNSEYTPSNTQLVVFQKSRTGNMGMKNLYISLIRRQKKTKQNKRSQIEMLQSLICGYLSATPLHKGKPFMRCLSHLITHKFL